VFSNHADLNSTHLSTTITPGDYELIIAYYLKDIQEVHGAIGGPFIPFSIHVTADPLIE
jgi:hypothetical protein